VATGRLEAQLDRLLDLTYRCAGNQKMANHLRHEQPHLFTFLRCPGLHATNNIAERAIRLMAMARKTWGRNRTIHRTRTQQILASVLRTCWQQGKCAFDQLVTVGNITTIHEAHLAGDRPLPVTLTWRSELPGSFQQTPPPRHAPAALTTLGSANQSN